MRPRYWDIFFASRHTGSSELQPSSGNGVLLQGINKCLLSKRATSERICGFSIIQPRSAAYQAVQALMRFSAFAPGPGLPPRAYANPLNFFLFTEPRSAAY